MSSFPLFAQIMAKALELSGLHTEFMRHALIGLVLLTPMCAIMGIQVVNFRMAFFSDAISHSAFTGIALGILLGTNIQWTVTIFAVVIGVCIMQLGSRATLSMDTVIGVFFATVVAFGLAIVSRDRSVARDVQQFLYGDILTISHQELISLICLFVVLMLFQVLGYNRLLYVGLNPVLAAAHRVNVQRYQVIFSILLSLIVIFSVWTVGILLVTALIVVPAASARNLARSAGSMFWWALIIGLTSGVAGLFISLQPWVRTATGATIVLCSSLWFIVGLIVARTRKQFKM